MPMTRGKEASVVDELRGAAHQLGRQLAAWAWGPVRQAATALALGVLRQVGRNMAPRRLLSFPHALVVVWMVILVWGERWLFDSKVDDCAWHKWERWPKGATPHHLILVADPQIIDAHSYPGRRWPLSALTVVITDNYMRRGYRALQRHLHPDSLFFLGDLFDGGREWKTRLGPFVDPKWGTQRPGAEKKWVKRWHRNYGEEYWLREYRRFAHLFFEPWNAGGGAPGAWQRGRKLVASLPGNHDLGFGAQVQVPVRDRFSALFGDVNRVDVVGNHTVVSVDTVSLSAGSSPHNMAHDLPPIYGPADAFLARVQATKRRAVRRELNAWYGGDAAPAFRHQVEDLDSADDVSGGGSRPTSDADGADLPTILLTHVPLYREPGTPCGPQREHRPPAKPPKGQTGPVVLDEGNAIAVAAGYQYQNVLSEKDSARLIKSVGNITHVFSGDDHDYCDVVHSEARGGVREITVKSFSMAMGVSTPGFVMVSLYNPVRADGRPTREAGDRTIQTHLCLLPNQMRTYIKYLVFAALSVGVLAARALLVPVLHLEPFALEPVAAGAAVLPFFEDKAKAEPPVAADWAGTGAASWSARSASTATERARWAPRKGRVGQHWSRGGNAGPPRITLDHDFYDGSKAWKTERGRRALAAVGRELWTTVWRVAWMTAFIWAYLTRKG